ncbi:MAG: right-handed parallel beta-helix repeat-containing protein, partial [Verrucomicrobiota bacterium]
QPTLVTTLDDSGPGSLREALADAAVNDTIHFAVSGTIALTSGELSVPSSVTLLGPGAGALTVSGNNASRVFNVTGTNVTISGLTIADGFTDQTGAGVYAAGGPGSVLTLSGCIITNNNANDFGGGLYNSPGGTMTVSNCAIAGNSTTRSGGGIYNDTATLKVIASTLSGNSAIMGGDGGGILNYAAPGQSATLTVSGSTLSGNVAGLGGGIGNMGVGANATAVVSASTFSSNVGPFGGGGIYNWGLFGIATVEIGDTILNAGISGGNFYNDNGVVTSDGYNLSSDDGGGFLTATGDRVHTDPKLGPLQDNGGPTWTHALLAGSPALDNGKTNAVPALASATDQRDLPRPVDNPYLANAAGGDGSDIGAYEVQGSGGYDIDTDGLPDFWELAWFGNLSQSGTDDSDGTGQNNLFKFTAGLDPTDPTSVFKLRIEAVAGQPNQRHLIFSPWAAGRTYTPQFTTNLAVTAFAPLTGYGGPTTNGTEVTITDPNAGVQQKFYRMQISVP